MEKTQLTSDEPMEDEEQEEYDWARCDAEAVVEALSKRYHFSRANAVQLLLDKSILHAKAQSMTWKFRLFVLAFMMGLGASVAMIAHALKASGSGHENIATPLCMMAVELFEMPMLWQKKKDRDSEVNKLLFAGTVIAFILWTLSLLVAL